MKPQIFSPKILVVDDETLLSESRGWSLLRKGCSVAWAGGPQEAMDWLGAHCFDAVLVDIDMCHRKGMLLVQAIRERFPCLPILLFSAEVQPDMKVLAEAYDTEAVMESPIDAKKLLYVVKRACGGKEVKPTSGIATETRAVAGRVG